ncbi:Hemagglutinin [hydrothermal vent metagenome]|uniref:Peptidoglycan hydrolase n=1 Tax=hydrothermal vent metagenome TaxID=652676 RepID=A0A3B0TBF4_9ZZZZ
MIKKIATIAILGVFLIGCKAKQRVSYADKNKKTAKVTKKKSNSKKYIDDGGIYPMPEDTGEFVRLEISSIDQYIETFAEIAQLEMKAYGIPASITLAQGLLESGFGKGELAMKTNNHFGIKCHTGWQGDYDFYDDDEKGECFRKYNHPMYSYRDHSLFLSNRSRYAFLFDLDSDNYKKWAKGLRQAGYATDKRYPQKLIHLIETHQLYKYDRTVANVSSEQYKNAVSTEQLHTHIVQKGDTLYSISKRYLVTVDELKKINSIDDNNIAIGQKLTIRPE